MVGPIASRREMLAGAAALPAAALADTGAALKGFDGSAESFAALYEVDRSIANFDAAYYGAMPRIVHAAYLERTAWINRHNSLFLRSALSEPRDTALNRSRAAVAGLIGCATEEVALCNGGTEALYSLIVNYRPLKAGDAVLIADVDYDEMQHAMAYLAEARGARLVSIALPEPATEANVLAAYEKALRETPRAKLLLLTHLSNRSGLIPPVREIVALAKTRGVDVILDSAQTVGQVPFTVAGTGADFIGFSLHKWVAAPLGTGAIYIRKERLGDIAPFLGNKIRDPDDIRARILTGTINHAAHLTIPTAIDLHRRIGPERKLAHLLALRDHWYGRARDLPGIEFQLADEPGLYAAITAFRPKGLTRWEEFQALQKRFLDRHRVLIVAKRGLAAGPVMRVTPSLFNTTAELDRLVAAIRAELRG
jgi:selenocysteine lyase/cysteine desulfurase